MKPYIAAIFMMLFAFSIRAAEMTPQEILDHTIEALGGAEKIKALQTREAVGKVQVAGLQGSYHLRMKSPDQMRLDLDLGVLKQSRGYDGKEGWIQQASVAEQSGSDLERLKRSALFLPLFQYYESKVPVKVKGSERVAASEAYILEFTPVVDKTEQFYIDSKTFLPVREIRQSPNREGTTDQLITEYADYRKVNGIQFPFSITQTQPGQVLTVKFDEIKTNIPLAAELFQNPSQKFANEPYDVTLLTIPHHVYKENDGLWEDSSTESFYFRVVIQEKHSRPVTPVSASMKFYSGQTLVKSVDYSGPFLESIRFTSLGGFANQQEVFDLTHSFSEPVKLNIDRLVYKLELKTDQGQTITKELEIPVEAYHQKTKFIFPIKGKFMVAGGHDFNEPHHEEWSQHYAYDIVGLGNQFEFSKNSGKRNEDFFTWGREVVAPAEGTIVYARNDVPENPNPGTIDNQIFMSRPDPMRAVGGNNVVIDHGNGEFSFLAHMQQGSVKVKQGDRVKQGDLIGLLGNTGNSDAPHLHYHLMACDTIFRCDGLPSHFENIYDAFSGQLLKATFVKRGLFAEAK